MSPAEKLTVKMRARIWPPGLLGMLRVVYRLRPLIGETAARSIGRWLMARSRVTLKIGKVSQTYPINAIEPTRPDQAA